MEKIDKFKGALNTVAQKWCGVSNAYDTEQAADILRQFTENQDEDTIIALLCELAYGLENIAVRDANLAVDHHLRHQIKMAGKVLADKADVEPPYGQMINILVDHWRDFDAQEKCTIADVVIGLSKLQMQDKK